MTKTTHVVWPHVLHVCGETLVQPEIIPPLHGHQVAEPLVRYFMGHHNGHIIFVGHGGALWIIQQGWFPDKEETLLNGRPYLTHFVVYLLTFISSLYILLILIVVCILEPFENS